MRCWLTAARTKTRVAGNGVPVRTAADIVVCLCRRIENRQGSRVKHHPVPRKAAPHNRRRIRPATPTRSLSHEEQKIERSIPDEAVDHVSHPVKTESEHNLPEVLSALVPDQPVCDENCWEPHDENADM